MVADEASLAHAMERESGKMRNCVRKQKDASAMATVAHILVGTGYGFWKCDRITPFNMTLIARRLYMHGPPFWSWAFVLFGKAWWEHGVQGRCEMGKC